MHIISVSNSSQPFDRLVAKAISQIIESVSAQGKTVSLALAGGNTPLGAYKELVEHPEIYSIDWKRLKLFLSDERVVPPSSPDSNQHQLEPIFSPTDAQLFWPDTSSTNPDLVAKAYEQIILNEAPITNEIPSFDCILLGIGPDGHTASIFPESAELDFPSSRLIIPVVDSPKPPANRVSFSLKLINNAKNTLVLATGNQKAPIVKSVVLEEAEALAYPIAQVKPNGSVHWIVDQSAASQLPSGVLK